MARPVSRDDARQTQPLGSRADLALSGLVMATFFSRFYLPAESAAQGETLWIVALWLMIGLATSLTAWRSGCGLRRLDGLDAAVLMLIGGQVASAVLIVLTTGDKRAAINMAWEWVGVGVVWCVLRPRLANASFRESFVRASIVTGVVLGGLGLWQHYVSQPQTAAEYGPLFDRLRTASGSEAVSIQRQLSAAGIPTAGPGLTLFEKRLRDSREPMGLFGLANTLGGCLAVWLVLAIAQLRDSLRGGRARGSIASSLLSISLIAWCLLLTKSRTAVVGAGCGTLVLLAGSWSPSLRLRRAIPFLGLGLGALIASVGLLILSGGLDREVLSEATKSLGYRLQYWQATSQLVADHIWLGVGPGNFRQHYLKYKLPEASEEIADPHNLFLDVAATGGVISLIGLMLLLALALRSRFAAQRLDETKADEQARIQRETMPVIGLSRSDFWFAGMAPVLAFAGLLSLSGEWDDRPLVLAVAWLACAWVEGSVNNGSKSAQTSAQTCFAACSVLAIHLLGAGGIAMPAVSQLLLALIACCHTRQPEPANSPATLGRRWILVASVSAALLTGLFTTALVPSTRCQAWLLRGDQKTVSTSWNASDVEMNYRLANLADPLSSEPLQRLAELSFRTSESEGFRSNELFDTAVRWQRAAIACNPHNFQGPQALGNWELARWRVTQREDVARQATRWLRQASDSYPTNAALLAELAQAYRAAGLPADAVETAKRALLQDELNRSRGHVDRYLMDDVVEKLSRMKAEE